MSPTLRRSLLAGLAATLVAGALYLYAARGSVIFLDLALAAGRMFCL